jgi:hypothetical protein
MSDASEVWWFLGIVVCAEALLIYACIGFGWERRPHFAVRVLLLFLVPLSVVLLLGLSIRLDLLSQRARVETALMLLLACLPAMVLVPAVLYRRSDSSSGEGSDGGDPVPDPPSYPPGLPGGGLLLPDSDQGRWRVRDHQRPDRRPVLPRRPSREPAGPARTTG